MAALTTLLLVGVGFAAITFGPLDEALPEERPAAVVETFYEYISEAKIRGGSLLINEAYNLTTGAQTQTDRALFLGIINQYPSGFRADIVHSRILDRHAIVGIEYQMPSSFGGTYSVQANVYLTVDDETQTWKLDFRGDTDDQDREKIANAMQSNSSETAFIRSDEKIVSQ
jgi:hypothetical protein